MGIYQYTCRAGTIEVDGRKIGRFAFAYKLGGWDGWEPDSFRSNKYVKMFESKAKKAREALATDLFISMSQVPTKKNLYAALGRGYSKLPVYRLDRSTFQYTEYPWSEPIGHLYLDADQKIRFAENQKA